MLLLLLLLPLSSSSRRRSVFRFVDLELMFVIGVVSWEVVEERKSEWSRLDQMTCGY